MKIKTMQQFKILMRSLYPSIEFYNGVFGVECILPDAKVKVKCQIINSVEQVKSRVVIFTPPGYSVYSRANPTESSIIDAIRLQVLKRGKHENQDHRTV